MENREVGLLQSGSAKLALKPEKQVRDIKCKTKEVHIAHTVYLKWQGSFVDCFSKFKKPDSQMFLIQ